jgi:CO/xanthine dehydrogenase Mo-binding subunit
MDGPAPAILNAVAHATGEEFCSIPLLPEDICQRVSQRRPVAEEAVAV